MDLKSLREILIQVRADEHDCFGLSALARGERVIALDGGTLKVLQEAKGHLPLVGFGLFDVKGVIPVTEIAKKTEIRTLGQAVQWCSCSVESSGISCCEPGFDFRLLVTAAGYARQSPAVCAVILGVDIATANALASNAVDRMTAAYFEANFRLDLEIKNTNHSLLREHRDPAQQAIQDFVLSVGHQEVNRALRRLMRRIFDGVEKPLRSHGAVALPITQTQQRLTEVMDLFESLQLPEATMRRFFELLIGDCATATSLSRKLRWQIAKTVPEQTRPPFVLDGPALSALERQVKRMLIDALGTSYTTFDVIEVFLVVCLVAVRSRGYDSGKNREAFWIAKLEKRLQEVLRVLAWGEADRRLLCGEQGAPSAKNNNKGENNG